MAAKPVHDDFDMPNLTDEMLAEFNAPVPEVPTPLIVPNAKKLHMSSTRVPHVHKPKTEPLDLVGSAIWLMYLGVIWLLVQAWTWVLSN